ncbi:MAG TPA: Flp family type IVb pilin [Xanthobacteraceae bacterium]|jgi:pilus assembly protein Flp/PilA|nr:Flp family type IVb pilin [Xanthobacteraceae bacterium]
MNLAQRFVKDESGATAIEYGLIAGLVSVIIITALTTIGTQLNAVFTAIAAALTGVPKG